MNNIRLRNIIKKKSFNIYLYVNNSILLKRLENSKKRPLLNNTDIKKTLDELIKKREQHYKKADLKIKNCQTVNETINELKKKFYINE